MPSRSELESILQLARDRFDAAVQGIEVEALETQAVCGVWSTRDVAGHIADWNNELLSAAEFGCGYLDEPRPLVEDGEAYNARQAAKRKSQIWTEAKAELDASLDRAARLLGGIDEEQLAGSATYPWGAQGTVAGTIYSVPHHMDEHVIDLERAFNR